MFLYRLQSTFTFTISNDSQENMRRYYPHFIVRKTASAIKWLTQDLIIRKARESRLTYRLSCTSWEQGLEASPERARQDFQHRMPLVFGATTELCFGSVKAVNRWLYPNTILFSKQGSGQIGPSCLTTVCWYVL